MKAKNKKAISQMFKGGNRILPRSAFATFKMIFFLVSTISEQISIDNLFGKWFQKSKILYKSNQNQQYSRHSQKRFWASVFCIGSLQLYHLVRFSLNWACALGVLLAARGSRKSAPPHRRGSETPPRAIPPWLPVFADVKMKAQCVSNVSRYIKVRPPFTRALRAPNS